MIAAPLPPVPSQATSSVAPTRPSADTTRLSEPVGDGAGDPDVVLRTLGVLGGGQLGRMFVHAAQTAGYRVVVVDPDASCPAAAAADVHLPHRYDDPAALSQLTRLCSAVTTEFENVPANVLADLAEFVAVSPPAAAVRVAQHRGDEKRRLVAAGLACAPFATIASDADVAAAIESDAHGRGGGETPGALLPGILKTSRLGYDGKGQCRVDSGAALAAAWASLGRVECVLERRVPLGCEFSVVVARGADGACVHLPPQQNLHRDGVLAVTQVPAPDVPPALALRGVRQALRLAAALDYIGVLCVEFFVLDDGSLLANEIAPRPHNSGHHSIDSCDVSQFDLQVRTLAGLPLTAPRLHSAAVMLNLLGDLWFDDVGGVRIPRPPDWRGVLALPGTHLHLYGKAEPRRGRKMGHLTVTAVDAPAARATALRAAALLGLPSF